MAWRDLVPWLLFLHVLAAIVAIGPNFAYSTIRALGQGEPQHGNFATRVSHAISARLVYPIGLVIPASGIAMILILGHRPDRPRLVVARRRDRDLQRRLPLLVLRAATNRRADHRADRHHRRRPVPAARRPGLAALATRASRGGTAMLILLVVVVSLMVVKPQF